MSENNKEKKLVTILFACFAAVCFLTGTVLAVQAAKLGYFICGREVEGMVYDYEVSYSSGSRGRGGYHCYLYCSYVDDNGHVYKTEFQYNLTQASKEDAENCGKNHLNKPIALYINGADVISKKETERYVPYVIIGVVLFCAGAGFVAVPLIVKGVKKRRAEKGGTITEDRTD